LNQKGFKNSEGLSPEPQFDLEAARLVRLRQELETLLAQAEPECRERIMAMVCRYPREGLEIMPQLRAVVGPRLQRWPWPYAVSDDYARPANDAGLAVEPLADQPLATLWPYRPKREPDELFSSWLWRIAGGLGAPPKRFAREVLGSYLPDIDRDISDTAIERLAFLSGQTREHLLRGTMRPDVTADPADLRGRVQQRLLRHGDLVLNRSRRGRRRGVPVIQYCPVCLRRDRVYLRRGWRFSLEIACFADGCFLLDACWRCGALLDPLAQTVPSDEFLCIQCAAPLARAPSLSVRDSVGEQDTLYAALDRLAPKPNSLHAWHGHDDDYVSWHERNYVEGLSSGDLRGTDPTNAAARLAALALAAWDLRYAPVARPPQPLPAAKRRKVPGRPQDPKAAADGLTPCGERSCATHGKFNEQASPERHGWSENPAPAPAPPRLAGPVPGWR
jgi:TniQ